MNGLEQLEKTEQGCARWYGNPWFFYGSASVLLFCFLGARSLWGSEGRWAEVAREMMLRHDYFHPTINWTPYFDKPLLTYWVIVLTSWITGSMNELVARFPGAAAGLVSLWATVTLAERLFGRRAAYLSGWILLTSFGFLFWSRTACADVENVAFIVLAVLWYHVRRNRPGFVSFLVFYAICATGAQFKGLPAVVVPCLACLPDMLRRGGWRRCVSVPHIAALVTGILLYLAPFWYASLSAEGYGQSGFQLVFRENILRFFNAFDHKEPFYVYFRYVPLLFFPWTPVVTGAVADGIRNYRSSGPDSRWLTEAWLIVFIVFTLSSSRRSYYILPIMPFLAIAAGNFLSRGKPGRLHDFCLKAQMWLLVAAGGLAFSAPALSCAVTYFTGIVPPQGLAFSLFCTGALSLAGIFLCRRFMLYCQWSLSASEHTYSCSSWALPASLLSALILSFGYFCHQQLVLEKYRSARPFVREVRRMMGDIPPDRVALGMDTANLIFYLGFAGPVRVLKSREDVAGFLADSGRRFIIVQRKMLRRGFAVLPDEMKRRPLLASAIYPGQRTKKMQLLAWELNEPLRISVSGGKPAFAQYQAGVW